MNQMRDWINLPVAVADQDALLSAEAHQAKLTKPSGALGRLEQLAIRLAALQARSRPSVDKVHISVFAGDHGVAAEGVSAFPQSVTAEMVRNFARGGAAISVLARELGATLEVINLGTVCDTGPLTGVRNVNLGSGTANLVKEPAMTEEQLLRALHSGRQTVEQAKERDAALFIGGEMGIGNSSAAAALACALLHAAPERLAGPGTGLDASGIEHKADVIRRALNRHNDQLGDPLEALRRLGGFEIAALAGSFLACAKMGLCVLVDGFISSVAALTAVHLCQGTGDWLFYAHRSAEPGHRMVLQALDARPLLDLEMRLGEGSGAAIAVPLLRLACSLHNGMATFGEAGVSEKSR